MNLFQKVRHRKSLGRKEKDLANTNPGANPWGDNSPSENENIIGIDTSPHLTTGAGETPPPLPAHRNPLSERKSPFAQSRPVTNGQLRRSSAMMGRRQSVLGMGEENEDTKLMRDSQEAMRRLVADEASSPIGKSSLAGGLQHSMLALGDGDDEDAKLARESVEALRQISVDDMPRARSSWLNPLTASSYNAEPSKPLPAHQKDTDAHSFNVLPRKSPSKEQFHEINLLDDRPSESSFKVLQRIPAMEPKEDNLFDSANVASMWSDKSATIPDAPPKPKSRVMTPAQFEKYRQEQERLKSIGYKPASEKDDEEDTYEEEEDDEDEEEKRREQARQRRKQEAHMTVYRQQMMKITGDVMAGSQRPPMTATQSTPNLELDYNIADPEDEDEDIPLAILQAHGFPNRNRAPGQLNGMSSNPNLRASSQMGLSVGSGSVAGGGNRTSTLPAFARRLPQDPYNYGAGIVNPTNRESLTFGSGSQYGGGGPQRPIAGGLVGVIANEERSRAMRRGSPNAQGEYPAMPANMLGAAPPPGLMNRSSIMLGGPMMQQQPYSDSAMMQAQLAQMQAQLKMNAEMQLQFFNMLSGAPPPPMSGMPQPGGMPPRAGSVYGIPVQTQQPGFSRASTMNMSGMNGGFLNVGGTNSRPGSANNGRPFTVADPNFPTLGNLRSSFMPAGYAGSITPSERSNVGQPGRYRPISHMPQANVDTSRTSTMMSGGLGNWSNSPRTQNGAPANGFSGSKPSTPTVRILPLEQDNEEDEEKEWEEMRKKKEKKKSMWRMKRKDNDHGDIAHLTN